MTNQVEEFLRDLELISTTKAQIVNEIRTIFQSFASDTVEIEERFIYGGVGFFIHDKIVGGAYANKNHVNMVFSQGNELSDPNSLLQGKGKYRRHLQLFEFDELQSKDARAFAKQIVDLANKVA